jgi:exopolysaccharide biosynthesis polyprenyl glycosylphosphotransferase
MIAPRTRGRIYLQSLLDAFITFSCFWACLLAFILLHPGNPAHYFEFLDRYFVYSLVALGAILLHGARTLYSHPRWWTPNFKESHNLSLNQVFNVAIGISFFLVATKDKSISRIFLFSWLPLLYVALLAANRFLPHKIAETVFSGRRERTVLLGSPDAARSLAAGRDYQETQGTAFLEDKPDFSISDLAGLENLIREQNVTKLILTEIPEVKYNLQYVIEICERAGVRLMAFSNFDRLFRHKVTITEDAGLQFVALRDEPLESPHNRVLKRMLDLLIAVPAMAIILPPVAALVWLVQRFQSPGPLFLKQTRAGLKGRFFFIYKFRTMHPSGVNETRQACAADDRVYRFGRWLRQTSLDELPQLFNVLRGEMSAVGPRPHLIAHNEQFSRIMRTYYIRSNVKPGMSGLAQVRGYRGQINSEQDVIRRVESDISYLETWSLSLDLVILARTAWQVLRPPKSAV